LAVGSNLVMTEFKNVPYVIPGGIELNVYEWSANT
jgi:neutral trehalase